jgi:tetratricopeptide (TPR) repeat protein
MKFPHKQCGQAARFLVPGSGFGRLVRCAAWMAAGVGMLASQAGATQEAIAPAKKPGQTAHNASPFGDAEELLRQGKFAEAKNRIEEELRQNPSNAEGYALLGLVFTQENNYSEASSAFEQSLKLDPKSNKVRNSLGNIYVLQGKPELAEKEFRESVRRNPEDHDGNYNLGLVLIAEKKPAEAIAHLQNVRPPSIESQMNLARAYLEAGRTAEGLRTAKELSAKYKDYVQVHFTLGILLGAEKQYRAAVLELEQANALKPQTFEVLSSLGQVYLQSGQNAQAELTLNRALKLKPDSGETMYLLGQVYANESKPVDALDLLVRAHRIAPENVDILLLLARVSMSQNYYEDTIPLLEAGLKLAPERTDLLAALGECYFIAGKVDKAIETFGRLLELEPSARSYAFMGLTYRRLGRFDEARNYFLEGLKKDPHDISCLFNLGYIDERQGNQEPAERYFQRALLAKKDHAETLLELANLRIAAKRYEEAAELLRKYVKVSPSPAPGYYKLAMVERSLHQTEAAQRDLSVFQTLSKNAPAGPYPYQHFFDYLDNRANLSGKQKTEQDLADLAEQIQKNPDQPENLYLLAEENLKIGRLDEARKAIAQLDQLSGGDFRTQTGVGVLLAQYRLYDEAISHFQMALEVNPDSDDVKFDLADAYFRKGLYADALQTARQVSAKGQQDDTYLSLLADIQAHLGQIQEAEDIYRSAIQRNPDNDQYYLSLTLLELRQGDVTGASKTLQVGLARIPGSGKLLWGQGLLAALEGNTEQAARHLEHAVDLLPEWPGSYSTLGVFYYQTGQIAKAKEVLNRFKGSNSGGVLDVNRIQEALEKAPPMPRIVNEPMPMALRQQLLQFALSMADRTL